MDMKIVTRILITELIILARYTRVKYELKRSFVRNTRIAIIRMYGHMPH